MFFVVLLNPIRNFSSFKIPFCSSPVAICSHPAAGGGVLPVVRGGLPGGQGFLNGRRHLPGGGG